MLSDDIIAKYKQAGVIAKDCLQYGASLIRIGANMRDILDAVEERITSKGGGLAFPAQISLNRTAAHYCPTENEDIIFKEGDVAKIDIGVHIDGYIADTAMTVDLGDNKELVTASKDALDAALAIIRPGVTLGEIGKAIQDAIVSHGHVPVHNLSGHGLGRYSVHESPNVPNVDTKDTTALTEGQVIAIEPFATNGAGEIFESSSPTIFSLIDDRPVRSRMTREVLRTIKSYDGLPFTTRWLTKMHPPGKVSFALRELPAAGNVAAHPPLPDKAGGLVSQHEHSVIVADEPIIYTR